LITIDGSYGEGGGQILRNAVALSTITNKPVKITDIRANRPNPGIKAQHYVALKSIAEICNAETKGLEIGSTSVTFKPGKIKGGKYKFEVGTAGSITLAFQAIILSMLKTKEPVTISLTGGTDVRWSPSWNYFENVFLPLIKKMGVNVFPRLILRGYYPKGGGEAVITINPVKKIQPLKIDKPEYHSEVNGLINISNLPDHIIARMKKTVIKTLLKNDLQTKIDVDQSTSLSPGVGVTLWSKPKDTIIGCAVLGEKDISSEEIGKKVSETLFKEIEAETTLDVHAFDQVLPYMALAKGNGVSKCIVRELSSHASTNMWLIQQFLDVNFEALQSETNILFTVK
jgi:RNA 3'-phosphate cyclase